MPMRTYLFFPALTMSLGWGLRGFIGGGPFGAMIPGALVALALCLLLRCEDRNCGIIAAFGAVGVGFGGEMTYGQTVGFILQPENYLWGLTGLTVKGAVWGLLGGAVLGMALSPKRPSRKDMTIGLGLLVAGTWVGWKLINEPKLIYFSNRFDKPRGEVWAGLLLGAMALLAWLLLQGVGRIPSRFALWGALGGGIGFGAGGTVMSLAHNLQIGPKGYDWWKIMELTFGFCFGLALGLCAWFLRQQIQGGATLPPEEEGKRAAIPWLPLLAIAALIAGAFWLEMGGRVRFPYVIVGAGLLLVAFHWRDHAWHIAVTLTFSAFTLNLAEFFVARNLGSPSIAWAFAVVSAAGAFCLVLLRQRGGRPMATWSFLFLTWMAVEVSIAKALMHPLIPQAIRAGAINETMFLVMALAMTWIVSKQLLLSAAKAA